MNRTKITCLSVTLVALFCFAGEAFGHGGAWRGPSGGGVRKPADPTPGPNRRPADTTPSPGGGTTMGTPWPGTWALNRETLMHLRALQRERAGTTSDGESPHFLGRGRGRKDTDSERTRIRRGIVDALIAATDDGNADVVTGAIVALGKSGDPRCVTTLMKLARQEGAHQTVNESAALALGMLGTKDPEIRVFLSKMAADSGLAARTRAFACIGLGYHGDIGAIPALTNRMRAKEASRDVSACATLALGLLGDEIVVPDLVRGLGGRPEQRTGDDVLRAYLAAALGKVGSRAAMNDLVRALTDKSPEVRRQAVLSLGAITKPADEDVVKRLGRILTSDRDVPVKAFAAFSLGEIGSDATVPLLLNASRKGEAWVPQYAMLGIALTGRKTKDPAVRERLVRYLRAEFRRVGSNDMRAAIATSLGIIGDGESGKALLKIVDSSADPSFRVHSVLALGLLNHRQALPVLRRILTERGSPVIVREAALTLGVMGDREAVSILTDLLRNGSSEYVRGSAAVALGQLATPETATELLAVLADPKATDMTRAFAAVALGLVIDERPVPILSRLGDHLNHFMLVPAHSEAITIL